MKIYLNRKIITTIQSVDRLKYFFPPKYQTSNIPHKSLWSIKKEIILKFIRNRLNKYSSVYLFCLCRKLIFEIICLQDCDGPDIFTAVIFTVALKHNTGKYSQKYLFWLTEEILVLCFSNVII